MSVEKYTASSIRFTSLHLNVWAPILIHSYLFFLTGKSEGHSIVVVVLYARTYNGFETCLKITAVTSEAAGVRHRFQWDHCTERFTEWDLGKAWLTTGKVWHSPAPLSGFPTHASASAQPSIFHG